MWSEHNRAIVRRTKSWPRESHASSTWSGHPSWTPDGKRIIFTKIDGTDFDGYGARRIASIDADGSDLQVIDLYLGTFPRLQPTP